MIFQGISKFWFITRKVNIMIHFNSFCFSPSEILSKSSQLCTKHVTYHWLSRKQRENSLKKQWFEQHSKKRWLLKHSINQYALPYYFLLPEGTTELLKVKKKKKKNICIRKGRQENLGLKHPWKIINIQTPSKPHIHLPLEQCWNMVAWFNGENSNSELHLRWGREVIYQTWETVFHWNIQTPRRELKIRCTGGYSQFEVFG